MEASKKKASMIPVCRWTQKPSGETVYIKRFLQPMSSVVLKEIFLEMVGKGDTLDISNTKEGLCIFLRKHPDFLKD